MGPKLSVSLRVFVDAGREVGLLADRGMVDIRWLCGVGVGISVFQPPRHVPCGVIACEKTQVAKKPDSVEVNRALETIKTWAPADRKRSQGLRSCDLSFLAETIEPNHLGTFARSGRRFVVGCLRRGRSRCQSRRRRRGGDIDRGSFGCGFACFELQAELNDRLKVAGIIVDEAGLTHLAYAPEIAGAMLRRQQAEAVIAARTKLVMGAVGMVEDALKKLAEDGVVDLDDERKAAMVSNLMVVLCGDREAQPVVNTGTLYQ